MSDYTIQLLILFIFLVAFFALVFTFLIIDNKLSNEYQLKKLHKINPNNKVINLNPDYKEKLKYQIKSCLIIVVTVFIICLICKLFGISVKDIADLF